MATDDGMGDGDWSELEKSLFEDQDEAWERFEINCLKLIKRSPRQMRHNKSLNLDPSRSASGGVSGRQNV
jgi:hypothetical protein